VQNGRAFILKIRPLTNTLSNLGNVLQQFSDPARTAQVLIWLDFSALLWGATSITTVNTGEPWGLGSLLG
jgi:hypothetical protein